MPFISSFRASHSCAEDLQAQTVVRFPYPCLERISRKELQSFLERKAKAKLSFSTVDHLRWVLHQNDRPRPFMLDDEIYE